MNFIKKHKKPVVLVGALLSSFVLAVNFYVVFSQSKNIVPSRDAFKNKNLKYILVLGCGIEDNEPSEMLYDRLMEGIRLAKENEEAVLFLSGDNSGEHYNEVAVMKDFCIGNGISPERIITDGKGFSTGESINNIGEISSDIIIVTQKFHLYRALFICDKMNVNAVGVAAQADKMKFPIYGALREILARNKDFFKYLNQ